MVFVDDEDRGLPCPRCKKITIKLVSLTDDGEGEKMCGKCKRKVRKAFPNKNFRIAKKGDL